MGWFQAIAHALGVNLEDAERLVTETATVIVRCMVSDPRALVTARRCLLTLFGAANGVFWSGAHGCSSTAIREDPTRLIFASTEPFSAA